RFLEIRHPRTGQKLLRDVVRHADVYPAADNDILVPDLVLIPVEGYGFSFSVTDAAPEISDEGTHRHNGIVLVCGDSIRQAASESRPAWIDLASTILDLLDVSVPSDMDGRVLEEIVDMDRPVRYKDVDNSLARVEGHYGSEEAEIVAQRLKGLGYLD